MPFTGSNEISVDYSPPMIREPETDNPMMNTSFRFIMDKVPNMTYFCQRVNLPSLSLVEVEQPTRFGAKLFKAGDGYNYEDLTIEFIVDENMKNWLEIHDWLRSCGNVKDTKEFVGLNKYMTSAELFILNSAYRPIRSVVFNNLIPTSIGSLQFDSSTTETEALIASATFRFSEYDIITIKS